MKQETRKSRVEVIRSELLRGLDFHSASFKEIDEKAKYWLTVCLPAFVGLAGYGLQQGAALSPYLLSILGAAGVCLFAAIYFFAETIGSSVVSAGILLPQDERLESLLFYVQSDEEWSDYEEQRAAITLSALVANEKQNKRKGYKLKLAETLLFRGLPAATCAAVAGTAFIHTCIPQWRFGASAGVLTGTAVGAALSAALWFIAHSRSPKP